MLPLRNGLLDEAGLSSDEPPPVKRLKLSLMRPVSDVPLSSSLLLDALLPDGLEGVDGRDGTLVLDEAGR